ncbi:hypothetical protein [Winogradskyella sp.]|uniref:hypothetical protein n=1 Tax=Winogradskyella sp. TaxID=1883156 RepID=UPI0026128852|nr:hypothetical protein [Winogradskyella sp.]
MRCFFSIVVLFLTMILSAQKEFHVFPMDGKAIKGSPNGDGSITNPWDLQTALSQSSTYVNGGDTIWLHEGIYTGNYISTLEATEKHGYITVSAYKNAKVIINGNIENKMYYVLEVSGGRVIFKNLEITFLGNFSRTKSTKGFKAVTGVNHTKGEDCKFQSLIIHNIPGSGFGSWKATGGTSIEDCIIYNNGYQGGRGQGVGIYVQNESEKTRVLKNNIIFNNYYKGIEVWSATSGTEREFVKNVDITNNVIFNNGSPSGRPWSNLIVASGDQDGVNVANNITIKNNVFYHNTDFKDTKNFGHGNSITLGYTSKALVEDISITDNFIIGRNNALNILHAKSLELKNNIIYTGYVHFEKSTLEALRTGGMTFSNNSYHTRKIAGLRILKHRDYKLSDWSKRFNLDADSQWKSLKAFEVDPVLKIEKLNSKPNHFNVVLLEKEGKDVMVDFSQLNIGKEASYKIYDIENITVVIKSGRLSEEAKVKFPMGTSEFEKPLHNAKASKSANNFGVYRIVFEETKNKEGFLKRFFGWLF